MKDQMTTAWQYYEAGRSYNNRLVPNQYNLVNTNIEFFAGNQWVHLSQTPAMAKLPKPTFNIIKRIVSLFVASLTSTAATVSFDELSYYAGEDIAKAEHPESQNEHGTDVNAAVIATAEVQNLFEKFKMDYRIREALFDGAQTGDYCAHFYWDPDALPYGGAFGLHRGEIRMELVDGLNVMFGNPNCDDTERQPYILLIGRDTIGNLKREAERFRRSKKNGGPGSIGKGGTSEDIDIIDSAFQSDQDYAWQAGAGGRTELHNGDDTGKALYVYMYKKKTHDEKVIDPKTGEVLREEVLDKNGEPVPEKDKDGKPLLNMDGTPIYKTREVVRPVTTVHVTKATKGNVIFEDVDTGLTRYPIAWGNWEKQKNQYHGRALVTGIVPNQIFINSMFAMVMRHLQLMGFPKTIYNADLISQWTNEVGQAIGVRGLQPGQRISDVAYNLNPADMSNQIIQAIDRAISYTKDCLGATDAQLGNVRADNTSALMVLQSSAEVPLENTRAGLYEWLEDIGAILLDMMGTYYGSRPIVRTRDFTEFVHDPATGQPVINPMTGTVQTMTVSRRVLEEFDFSQLKHLWLNVRVNAGATSYFSEIAMTQTLDNLRRDGTLDVIDYLERLPAKLIPRKNELIRDLRRRAALQQPAMDAQAQQAPQGQGNRSLPTPGGTNPSMGGALSADKVFANLPAAMQGRYNELPKTAQKALTKSM